MWKGLNTERCIYSEGRLKFEPFAMLLVQLDSDMEQSHYSKSKLKHVLLPTTQI